MKIFGIALLAIILSCGTENSEEKVSVVKLTIASTIDKETPINQKLINTLSRFLATKNNSLHKNEYWSPADFQTFWFPYQDIFEIERKGDNLNFYQPTLMEIVDTDEENKKLLKLAFIGHDDATKENTIKGIYNIMATEFGSGIMLSNPLPYFTKDWKKIKKGSLHYIVSPQKEFNEKEADKQLEDISRICEFFGTEPLPITYYSCTGPKELFQIKGFDYNPIMYREGGGGLSSQPNFVFSGNSSEFYTHEIMHLYISALFPSRAQLINEGLATYVGGSRTYSYTWHRENLKTYLEENSAIDLSMHLEPFERFFAGETSIPYMIGALICERTFRLYGKEKLLVLLEGNGGLLELLDDVGLTKENLDTELKKEIKLPPTLCM